VLARARSPLDAALASTSSALAVGALLLLVGVPLLVARVVRRGLRPLDELAGLASRIDARSLGRRFDAAAVPAELRPICQRLNDLLERLEASFDRERRFSSDVAHELRTPLAELRSIAEVALRYPEPATASPRSFEDVLGAALHMEALVTALLTLARCDSGRQPVSLQAVDLARLCREAWAARDGEARQRAVRVQGAAEGAVVVEADPVLLASVTSNLVANAVAHTPAGGDVAWRIERDGDQVLLVITNSNAALEPADLPHVFERFWRKDAARSGGPHTGLGLSLAEAFVRLMRGQLRLELAGADRVRVELRLAAFAAGDHLAVISPP
jgi:signal transduction histidine kinase